VSWALVLLLSWHQPPVVTWHASLEACQEAKVLAQAAHPGAERIVCESHRIPRLAPMTGEILR
jgi:hypothetical protein